MWVSEKFFNLLKGLKMKLFQTLQFKEGKIKNIQKLKMIIEDKVNGYLRFNKRKK